uniref:Histone deacetylation protein Rxt3 n=1 Tax=Physcomitrium patens TaxID=3218 RepID=A0A7I4DEM4_PHYPA
MSLPVKREHEETAAVVEGASTRTGKPQHVGGGSGVIMESAFAFGGGEGKEVQVQTLKIKLKDLGGGSAEGKSDREGRDPRRMDLERKTSGGKDYGDALRESSGNKELLGKVNMKGEEQLLQQGGSGREVGQELVINSRMEGNPEGLRKKSPREGEVKAAAKDVPMDVKKEELREKEKEKKDDTLSERKDGVLPTLLHPHLDANAEKDYERDEKERETGDKEKEKMRERERSRDKEKEAVRSEKREKREKERDRDSHWREREERDDNLGDKAEKEEGKGVKVEDVEMDRKPVREVDERKLFEKEVRERMRERDREKERDEEGDGEKRKKRGRELDKDRDSLSNMDSERPEGDKEKDAVHGYGVQQRKRMLRPRGQSNPSNRDPRSRFRPKDNEGTQGRAESSFITYRIGEGMPELAKLWKEYESGERNSPDNGSGPTVEIRIPAEHATTNNRQIRGSQLWGTDIYTNDSDIVAVLLHTGYYSPSPSPPPNSILELRATVRILESQNMYMSTLRNSIRSRAWGGGSGCSYSVERCRLVKQGGGTVELEPSLTRTPPFVPTLAPAASERTVTTRAASSSAYRQQRFMQEVTIQYNLCNEPWAKYSMSIVADRGLKNSQYTSARLKKGEVLYVETQTHRYELAYDGERMTSNGATTATSFSQGNSGTEKGKDKWSLGVCDKEPISQIYNGELPHGNHPSNGQTGGHHCHHNSEPHEYYRWSKCKRPLSLSSMKRKGVPLPGEFVEVLEEGLGWEEIQWSPTSVWVRGTEYILSRAQFFSFEKDDMEE